MSKQADKDKLDILIERGLQNLFSDREPPSNLWDRIKQQSDAENPETGFLPRRPVFAVAASLILLAVVFNWSFTELIKGSGQSSFPITLIDELHTFHISGRPLDVTEENPEALRSWFVERMEFQPPSPPDAGATAIKLVGGRLCQIESNRVVSYMYELAGKSMSLFITLNDAVPVSDDEHEVERRRGYGHIGWQSGDMRYSLVGPVPDEVLSELAETFKEHQPTSYNTFNLKGPVI
ncbi:MAG: hypothetical protein AAF434_19825 [Pseudomonadota bacterium]